MLNQLGNIPPPPHLTPTPGAPSPSPLTQRFSPPPPAILADISLSRPPPQFLRLPLPPVTNPSSPPGPDILDDISLSCRPGEFVVVVGPSGCGKSPPLTLAAGMTRPDAGQVSLDSTPVTSPGPNLSMVFQDHGLFP